jgi:hypothetical protein
MIGPLWQGQVLPSNMVDNSLSLCERVSGWVCLHTTALQGGFILLLATPSALSFDSAASAISRSPFPLQGLSPGRVWDRRQGRTEDFPRRPSSMGSSRCHGWSSLAIALRQTFAPSLSGLPEGHSE